MLASALFLSAPSLAQIDVEDVFSAKLPSSGDSLLLTGVDVGSGGSRIAVAGVSINANNETEDVTDIVYSPGGGGADQSFTCPADLVEFDSDSKFRIRICYLLDPTPGEAGEVEVTFNDDVDKGASIGFLALTGVDTSDPVGTLSSATGDSSSPAVDVTGGIADGLKVNFLATEKDAVPSAVSTTQTERYVVLSDDVNEVNAGGGTEPVPSGATAAVPMQWSLSTQKKWLIVGIPINPGEESLPIEDVETEDYGDAPVAYGLAGHTQSGLLETLKVEDVGTAFITVPLRRSYDDPIVVCTGNLNSDRAAAGNDREAVVRIRNASSNSFQVRIQRPGFLTAEARDVYCLVAEEGVHDLSSGGGPVFEARKVNGNTTNGRFVDDMDPTMSVSVLGTTVTEDYDNPVVIGQVMTFNEPEYSSFWATNCSDAGAPPSSTGICVSKHVGKSPLGTTRADETLGFIVAETDNDNRVSGVFNGRPWAIGLTSDSIEGVDDSPPYVFNPGIGIGSGAFVQAAEDGGDGGFAVLFGSSPFSGGMNLAIDEDTVNSSNRSHTTENVAYWALSEDADIFIDEPYLGFQPGDAELATDVQSSNAEGDDDLDTSIYGAGDDEDGVTAELVYSGGFSELTLRATVQVHNAGSGSASLCGWVDFDNDNAFD
ncbi:MAG: hypothetical protein AAGA95_19280, partial [Pseudomonadota bacterium]